MKIYFFGGSFDPPHLGHLKIIETCLNRFDMAHFILIPANQSPLKKNKPIAIFSSCQKFGQGQAGRIWHAPKGGVWVSAAINREGLYEKNSQLYGLAVALALVERIEQIGVNVKIKWTNDLLVDVKFI